MKRPGQGCPTAAGGRYQSRNRNQDPTFDAPMVCAHRKRRSTKQITENCADHHGTQGRGTKGLCLSMLVCVLTTLWHAAFTTHAHGQLAGNSGSTPAVTGEMIDCELRMVWGGGVPRTFAGEISLSAGSIELMRNLSLQDDSALSIRPNSPSELKVLPHSPSTFGGADIRLKCPSDASLTFHWSDSSGKSVEPLSVPVSTLLHGSWIESIDTRGSRLAVQRLSHDRIRVELGRSQPLYRSGDRCDVKISGHLTGLSSGEHRLRLRMVTKEDDRNVHTFQQLVEVDARGNFPPVQVPSFTLPDEPGVYTLEVSLQRKRLINSIIGAMTTSDRRLELVVTAAATPSSIQTASVNASKEEQWQPLAQVFPAGVNWWDALGRFNWNAPKALAPLVSHPRPLGNAEHGKRTYMGRECLVLSPGDWQAFPLHTKQIGVPHKVRVRVPSDRAMNLAISIQEPDAGGVTGGVRLDSGITVDPMGINGASADLLEHELVFWPRTEQPYLLLFNTDTKRDAGVAEIDVSMCDTPLLPAARLQLLPDDQDSSEISSDPRRSNAQRLTAIYYDKPLLADNFGALRVFDAHSNRALESWQTWYDAASRLSQYTQWAGYNTAVITVATQGSTIYPTRLIASSPKFDSGVFLSDGSDPEIKDMVELACREFDRQGLKLVLAIDLDGSLPELVKAEEKQTEGSSLFQLDLDGNAWQPADRKEAVRSIRYNPLEPRVQTALEHVIKEIVDRYSEHPCFDGIQINLTPKSHFNLAGDKWGYDAATLSRFERAVGTRLPQDVERRKQLLSGPMRLPFLNFRAEELNAFYAKIGESIRRSHPDAKLIINPAKLLIAQPDPDNSVRSDGSIPTVPELLLACGISPPTINDIGPVQWLRPTVDSPLRSPIARAWGFQLAADSVLDSQFAAAGGGSLIQQQPAGFRLPDFDAAAPFGDSQSKTWLFPSAVAGGPAVRQTFIKRLMNDDQAMFEYGGWMALMGQEAHLRPLLQILSALPQERFADVPLDGLAGTLRIRRLSLGDRSYLLVMNGASWRETVKLQIKGNKQSYYLSCIRGNEVEQTVTSAASGKHTEIAIELEPFSPAVVACRSADIELAGVESTPEEGALRKLEQHLLDLQSCIDRAGELTDQQVLGLIGGDFEEWGADGKPKGWTASALPNVRIERDMELPHSGRNCIRIENSGGEGSTAWIQSDRIAVPPTGRMAVEVWVRSAPGSEQPGLRLSLVGRYKDGKRFHRWHDFTQPSRHSSQIPIDWGRRPLVLLVPDVPSDELTDLNVAVDVIGPGKLWVDDVRVYGMYLHPDEKVHLLGQIFVAKEKLKAGDPGATEELLQSYWAYFLTSYLGPPKETATALTSVRPDSPRTETSKASAKEEANMSPAPSWRQSSQPRLNQWQESWRNRWQK